MVGVGDFECVEVLICEDVDVLIVDSVYGYLVNVIEMVFELKKNWDIDVVVGNVVICEGCKVLIDVGVDVVKVGIGFGLICMIWVVLGIGVF